MDADIRELVDEDFLFDPFAEDEDGGGEEGSLVGEPMEEREQVIDDRPPAERIAGLLDSMPGQRRTLLHLVDYCREEKTGEQMDAETEELKRNCFSVYTPVVFRELLERAGAIRYVKPEDASVDAAFEEGGVEGAAKETAEATVPTTIESYVAGEEQVEMEFLEVVESPLGTWVATPEGLAAVDAQDDVAATQELVSQEPRYTNIYHQILGFCLEEGGRSAKEVDRLVNDSPLLEEPRRYSGYFVSRLERKGALEWKGGWVTTDAGKVLLEKAAG